LAPLEVNPTRQLTPLMMAASYTKNTNEIINFVLTSAL
jgi:hypothetical protein